VGGCVRDSLLGRAIADIDIATPEAPERVLELLQAGGIKTVPTGIAHGTVTAVTPSRHFEVTTLRRDVETFGRHARVAFDAGWEEDARRRDFTMNALFLDPRGEIFDHVGGLADLRAGRVRFVGEAEARIREDVLRLLRFYRFHAHYGRVPADEAARAACRALAPLLPTLSGERVAAETLKLLKAPDPVPTLRLMQEDGVLANLFPEAERLDLLAALVAIEPVPDPVRRLGALLAPEAAAVESVADRLRLSNAQRERLVAIAAPPWPMAVDDDERARRRALHRLGAPLWRDLALIRAAEAGRPESVPDLLDAAKAWIPVELPLKGRDLRALGVPAGPRLGRLLAAIRDWWEAQDYRPEREECLAKARELIGSGDGA
jgi:poly(A) polymerase